MGKCSMSHLISFSRYQTKCVIKFLFRELMTFKINFKIFLESTSRTMADRGEKNGRRECKNLDVSRTKIAFKMKQKSIFHSF